MSFVSGAAVNLIACWTVAVFLDVEWSRQLDTPEVVDQLAFAFGSEHEWRRDVGREPSGQAHTGPLIRRAYVEGWTMESTPRRFSELVVKVGWPFTTVRGFVTRKGVQVEYDGSVPLRKNLGEPDEEKILPLQIVWPGFVLGSSIFAGLFFAGGALLGSRKASRI